MPRRRRDQRRRRAEKNAALLRQIQEIEKAGVKIGMSWDEALQLICDAAKEMRHAMTIGGFASKAPWGLTFDPQALEASINAGIRLFTEATRELSNPHELSEDGSRYVYLGLISGAMTLGAASLLYLQSQPLSYELARHVIAKDA